MTIIIRAFVLFSSLIVLTSQVFAAPAPMAANQQGVSLHPASTQPAQQQQPIPTLPPLPLGPAAPPPKRDSVLTMDMTNQATALRPEFAADIAQASAWDWYIITATLDLPNLRVYGEQRVVIENRTSTPFETLLFHLYPNHPYFGGRLQVANTVAVNGQPASLSLEQNETLLRVYLPQALLPGERAMVSMQFETFTQRNASGSIFGAFNAEAGVWSLASFYPVLARTFNGVWDERPLHAHGDLPVNEAALHLVTLDAPPGLTLVTSGSRISEEQLAHGPYRERFVTGPQREFFVAALAGLEQTQALVDGTTVTSYYRPVNAAAGQQALATAVQSVQAFHALYGPYPFTELEVIQIALGNFDGMEFPGVILIDEGAYTEVGRRLEITVAHEIAHQWWYNVVGSDQQGQAWLDEGLATYSQVLFYEAQNNPAAAAYELQLLRGWYLSALRSGTDGVVNRYVGDFPDRYTYFVLSYAKAGLFLHALRQQMGHDLFLAFLQRYYATYRYQEATGDDLMTIAEATCQCDLSSLYTDWIQSSGTVAIP
ncbi:MAG: M1 family metallopeptidase [Chloroflexaceae bacterium]|nr:M1 family metallopeptidase [Chloroflexaceae bacterium]